MYTSIITLQIKANIKNENFDCSHDHLSELNRYYEAKALLKELSESLRDVAVSEKLDYCRCNFLNKTFYCDDSIALNSRKRVVEALRKRCSGNVTTNIKLPACASA